MYWLRTVLIDEMSKEVVNACIDYLIELGCSSIVVTRKENPKNKRLTYTVQADDFTVSLYEDQIKKRFPQ